MARKKSGADYAVAKLEGLWPDGPNQVKGVWRWTLLIRIPDFIGPGELSDAIQTLKDKGKDAIIAQVSILKLKEGRSIQILHIGPYDAETLTIAKMERFASAQGLTLRGVHHEIYLSDPRRVEPDKLRTILRHPVA